MDLSTGVGLSAAFCATISYIPQLKKCWETGEAGDLSLGMFLTLFVGIALWVLYGLLKSDWIVLGANSIGLCFLTGILYFKVRQLAGRGYGKKH
jgi:MtN3 and saliva related transmembrane protein